VKLYESRFSRSVDNAHDLVVMVITDQDAHPGEKIFLVSDRDHVIVDLAPDFAHASPHRPIERRDSGLPLNLDSMPAYSKFFFHNCLRINDRGLALPLPFTSFQFVLTTRTASFLARF